VKRTVFFIFSIGTSLYSAPPLGEIEQVAESVMEGNARHVASFIALGGNVNGQITYQTLFGEFTTDLLHLAIANMQLEVARTLLDADANLKSQDSAGCTPLLAAIRLYYHLQKPVKSLNDRVKDLFSQGNHAATEAAFDIGVLLSCFPSMTQKTARQICISSPWQKTPQQMKEEILSFIYFILEKDDAGTLIRDKTQRTPLYMAVYTGNASLVKKLLDKGADPHLSCLGHTPITLAKTLAEKEDPEKHYNVYQLLKAIPTPTPSGPLARLKAITKHLLG